MSLVEADEVAPPRSPCSTSTTFRPRPAASRATPQPFMPPPMMARSKAGSAMAFPGVRATFAIFRSNATGGLKVQRIVGKTVAGMIIGFGASQRNQCMALTTNPFVVLSYVGGPALLTNATSLLLLSTANRFARAIDRSRYLTGLLNNPALEALHAVEVTELRMTGRRIWLIGLAISGLYLAAAMFALATVMSIVGAVVAQLAGGAVLDVIVVFAVVLGLIG